MQTPSQEFTTIRIGKKGLEMFLDENMFFRPLNDFTTTQDRIVWRLGHRHINETAQGLKLSPKVVASNLQAQRQRQKFIIIEGGSEAATLAALPA